MCRALLSVMDEHNVDSFISLSSPQMGQYGGEWALWVAQKAPCLGHRGLRLLGAAVLFSDTDYLKWLFPTSMRSNLYRICYSPWGQEFSICNYWHGKPRGGARVDTALWTARPVPTSSATKAVVSLYPHLLIE